MTTLTTQHGYSINLINGSYFVDDCNGDTWYRVDTLRKAKNRLKSILKCINKSFTDFKVKKKSISNTVDNSNNINSQPLKQKVFEEDKLYKLKNKITGEDTFLIKKPNSKSIFWVVDKDRNHLKMKEFPHINAALVIIKRINEIEEA